MTVREMYKNSNKKYIKTHIASVGLGIAGFYDADWLVEHYGDYECEIKEYEKDYGDGVVGTRSFLQIYDLNVSKN